MKKLMIVACGVLTACTAVMADGATAAKVKQAQVAANALLDEIEGKTKALPEDTATQLTKLAAQQNPPPAESEMKKDKGVQTVIKMQTSKKKSAEYLGRVVEDNVARTRVIDMLEKENGIKIEKTKDCYIAIVDVSLPVDKDPAQDGDFFRTRDVAMRMLALKMKSEVCKGLGGKFSAEESMAVFGSTNMSVKLESDSEYTAQWPIYGVTLLAQAESWDGKSYTLAGAAVWSKKLHAACKAMLCGEKNNADCGGESVEDWLGKADLSMICGPRQVLDENGNRVFLGVASRELTGNTIRDEGVKAMAEAAAREHLMFSIFSDVSFFSAHNIVADYSDKGIAKIEEGIDNLIAQRVDNRVVAYNAIDRYCGSYRHPMVEGKKVYVVVLRTSADDLASARVMAEELIATRKAAELANMRELGRLQGYLDQIAAAKGDTGSFEDGRTEGNAAIEKRSGADASRGKSRWSSASGDDSAAPARKKPAPKARKGVYSGDAPIKKNF